MVDGALINSCSLQKSHEPLSLHDLRIKRNKRIKGQYCSGLVTNSPSNRTNAVLYENVLALLQVARSCIVALNYLMATWPR